MPRRPVAPLDPVFLDVAGPTPAATPDMPLEAYARRWFQRQCRRLKSRGRETYRYNLELHILPALGASTPLASLTREQIADFVLGKLSAGYKPRSVWLMFKVLRAMLAAARLDDRVIGHNPTERIGRLLPKRDDRPETDAMLRRRELDAFLAAAEAIHPTIAPLFVLAARSGMRLGELLGLQWGDVDLARRKVIVRRTIDWRRKGNTPKGGIVRDLPLSRHAAEALAALANSADRPRSAWVFANRDGQPWSRTYVRRVMHRACARAGIPLRSVHALRHTFLTQLAEAGTNPWTIRDLARHRSITTTEGYLHLNQRHLPVVDALDGPEHTT